MTRGPLARRVIVGAVLSVNAGGADEPDTLCGASHFLEHLVFRATEKYEDAAARGAAIESVDGYLNASTSKIITAYLAAAPLEYMACDHQWNRKPE